MDTAEDNITNLQTAIDTVQADVDQNETDADAAVATVQADVDQNETDADAAVLTLDASLTDLSDNQSKIVGELSSGSYDSDLFYKMDVVKIPLSEEYI